jgi:hypothetical protein
MYHLIMAIQLYAEHNQVLIIYVFNQLTKLISSQYHKVEDRIIILD